MVEIEGGTGDIRHGDCRSIQRIIRFWPRPVLAEMKSDNGDVKNVHSSINIDIGCCEGTGSYHGDIETLGCRDCSSTVRYCFCRGKAWLVPVTRVRDRLGRESP